MKIFNAISTLFNKGVARKAARQREVEIAATGVVPHVIEPNPGEMSIVAHISDLRRHIVRAAYWYLGLVVLAFT
jgi:hypothetical protein